MVSVFRVMALLALILVLFAGFAGPALADDNGGDDRGDDNGGKGKDPAPEIDPSSAISGIALLTASMLLLADRRRLKT